MIIIVCIDDNKGMLFNRRRQSRDRLLRERVLTLTQGRNLYMNGYSARQFTEDADNIIVNEQFLSVAQQGDYCFVEDIEFLSHLHEVEQFIVYKWNTFYPADVVFPLELLSDGWKLIEITDFRGNSHKQITEEVYVK